MGRFETWDAVVPWSDRRFNSGDCVEEGQRAEALRQKDHLGSKCKNQGFTHTEVRDDSFLRLPLEFLTFSKGPTVGATSWQMGLARPCYGIPFTSHF